MTNPQPLPEKYAAELERGDTRVWEHRFFESPPDWAASTGYVVGVVGSGVYLADSTVTFGTDDDGQPVRYTCIEAHTSDAAFDAEKWQEDAAAVGAPEDISDWEFLSQYRATTEDATVLAQDECALVTDGSDGAMRRTLSHDQAMNLPAALESGQNFGFVTWDLQVTKPGGIVKTYLKNYQVKVWADTSRSDES